MTKKTPGTLWCNSKGSSAYGGSGGTVSDRRNGGGSDIDSIRLNKCDIPSDSTCVAIGSSKVESVEHVSVLPEGAVGLGPGGTVSLSNGSPDTSTPRFSGLCSSATSWLMDPLVEVLCVTETRNTSDATSCGSGLT